MLLALPPPTVSALEVNIDVKGWEVRDSDAVTEYLVETAYGKKDTWVPIVVKV